MSRQIEVGRNIQDYTQHQPNPPKDSLEGGESPSASLLGQAVSLLKGAKIPEASSQSARSTSLDSEGWFSDLPKRAKEALQDMVLPEPPNSPNAVELSDEEE